MSNHSDYFWHDKTWDKFASACVIDHLPHAMLLSGAKGVGKQAFAERMIKSLLCLQPDSITRKACNRCQGCKTYESGANPDFMKIQLLEDKKQIGVDQIRQLSEFLTYSRSFNAYRVVLINPVERMNRNATNSLLKSLEEPTNNTVILLIATHLSHIIPTIISRTQLLSIPLPTKEQAISWINTKIPDATEAEELLEMSAGSPLLALTIDKETLNNKEIFANDILSILDKDNSVTEIAKKWEKYDQGILLDWQIIWLQYQLKEVLAPLNTTTKLSKNADDLQQKFKHKLSKNMLWQLYQQLLRKKQIIHTSVNPLMNLESMLLLWFQASRI